MLSKMKEWAQKYFVYNLFIPFIVLALKGREITRPFGGKIVRYVFLLYPSNFE